MQLTLAYFPTCSEGRSETAKKVTKGFTHACNKCDMVRAMHLGIYVYYVAQVHIRILLGIYFIKIETLIN